MQCRSKWPLRLPLLWGECQQPDQHQQYLRNCRLTAALQAPITPTPQAELMGAQYAETRQSLLDELTRERAAVTP